MGYYLNCIKQYYVIERDIKELIPDMNLRRRMSPAVKMGVATALEALNEFEAYGRVDAVITATTLGCIFDSEKFLASLLQEQEQLLNPTPFIQSTFNTVGAQIALIKGLHGYNNTFSHRYLSFESALIDAMLCLDDGRARAVLVDVFDEATPTVEVIMRRMGLLKNEQLGEGAVCLILTAEQLACSVAELEEVSFDQIGRVSEDEVSTSELEYALWSGAIADLLADCVTAKLSNWAVNDLGGEFRSRIKIKSLHQGETE